MVYASIDVVALRECADRIRQHITTLDAHEEEETAEHAGARGDIRETAEPDNPAGLLRSQRTSMVDLFERKSISSVSVPRLYSRPASSHTLFETEDGDHSQDESSGSEEDFLAFHPSELRHIDETFELGISRQHVNQLLGTLQADQRVVLTEGIADWFSKAVTGSEAIEVELSEHELTCIEDELSIEEAHRVLGSHLQSRDVATINHMKRFFSKVEEFRPRKPLKRSTQTRLTQKFTRPPKIDRSVSFQTTTSDAASAVDAPVPPIIEGAATPVGPIVGIGGLPQQLTPIASDGSQAEKAGIGSRGGSSGASPFHMPPAGDSRSFDNLSNVEADDQENDNDKDEDEADADADSEKRQQEQDDDMAGVVVSDLLEVIAMQQDEISHFKTRNDLTAKGNESIRIALEHVRNTDDEDEDMETSSQSFSRSGPMTSQKSLRPQRDSSRGLPEAVRVVVKDMRENLQVKVLSELLMTEDGREHLKGAEANNPTIGTMVRQAALLHEVAGLKEQVKEVEMELLELQSPAERVEALRQQIDARQTEIQLARDDWQRRKNALANVQEAIEAEKKRSEANQGSQQNSAGAGPDAAEAPDELKPPEGPKPLNFTWILQAPDDVMQLVTKATSEVERNIHELFEKCSRVAAAVADAKKRAEETEKTRLANLAKQEEQAEERQLRDVLRKATAATHHFEEEKARQKVLEGEEKQLKAEIKKLEAAKKAALAKAAAAEKQKEKGSKKKKKNASKDGADSDGAPARVHQMAVERMRSEVENAKAEVDRLQTRHDSLLALVDRVHGTRRRSTLDTELPQATHLTPHRPSIRRTSLEVTAPQGQHQHRASVSELQVPGARSLASPQGASPELVLALPGTDAGAAGHGSSPSSPGGEGAPASALDLGLSTSLASQAGDRAASPPPGLALTLQSGPGTPHGSAPTTPSRGRPARLGRLGTRETPTTPRSPTGARSQLDPPEAPTPQVLVKPHDSGPGGSSASRPSTAGQTAAHPAGPTASPSPGSRPTTAPGLQPPAPQLAEAQPQGQRQAAAAEGPTSSPSPGSRPATGPGPEPRPPSLAESRQAGLVQGPPSAPASAPVAAGSETPTLATPEVRVAQASPVGQGPAPGVAQGSALPQTGPAPGFPHAPRSKSKKVIDETEKQIQELLTIQHQHERTARQLALVEDKIREAKQKIQGRKHNKEEASARPIVVSKPAFVPEENKAMRREVGVKQKELNVLRALWWSKKSSHGPKSAGSTLKGQAEAAAKLLLMLPTEDVGQDLLKTTGRVLVEDTQEEGNRAAPLGELMEEEEDEDEDEEEEDEDEEGEEWEDLKSDEDKTLGSDAFELEEEAGQEAVLKEEEKVTQQKSKGGKGSTWPSRDKQLAKTVAQPSVRRSLSTTNPMSRGWLGLEILSGSSAAASTRPNTTLAVDVAKGQPNSRQRFEGALDNSRLGDAHLGGGRQGSTRGIGAGRSASPLRSSAGRFRSPAEQFERVLEGSGLLGPNRSASSAGPGKQRAVPGYASPGKSALAVVAGAPPSQSRQKHAAAQVAQSRERASSRDSSPNSTDSEPERSKSASAGRPSLPRKPQQSRNNVAIRESPRGAGGHTSGGRRASFSGPARKRSAESTADESEFARRGSWGGRQKSQPAPSAALHEAFTVSSVAQGAPAAKQAASSLPLPSAIEEAPPLLPASLAEEALPSRPLSSADEEA